MDYSSFFAPYFEEYKRLAFSPDVWPKLVEFGELAKSIGTNGRKMIFAGNGASASLAEHAALDFTKQGKVRSTTFHDVSLMTAFANDFGYDNWMAKAVDYYADEGDAVVLISVSGTSPSVVEAARAAKAKGLKVVSFTGRNPANPLAGLSDLNFHVASDAYNHVECIHGIWVTTVIDFVIGKSVYETRMIPLKGA